MVLSRAKPGEEGPKPGGYRDEVIVPAFAQRYMKQPLKRGHFPQMELSRDAAFQIVADILQVDGKPRLNLASFVTTWMEPEAEKLMIQSLNKNAIDLAQYPAYAHIQEECVSMIARLYNAPLVDGTPAVGAATVGSSEAFMLAALAMKRRWQHFRREKGLPTDRPNMVAPATAHVVIEKFCNYFEVELRKVPVVPEHPRLRVDKAVELCDEDTVGVVTLLGSTYTGHFDDIRGLSDRLEGMEIPHGWQIPIHVDAASGGFVAPFLYPELEWDFRVPRVVSINASGHKYGLAYPGVGWVVFRGDEFLPKDLIYHVNYLGEDQPTFTINFSRGASHVIAQYYQFLRLGFEGYRNIMEQCATVADNLRASLVDTGLFNIMSDVDMGIPMVAFHFKREGPAGHLDEFELVGELRRHGWIMPAYSMPVEGGQQLQLARVCVREELSPGLAQWLVRDILSTVEQMLHKFGSPSFRRKGGDVMERAREEEEEVENGDRKESSKDGEVGEAAKPEASNGGFERGVSSGRAKGGLGRGQTHTVC